MKRILLALTLSIVLLISMVSVGVSAATKGDVDVDLSSVTTPVGGKGDIDVDMGDISKPIPPFEGKIIDFETQYVYDSTSVNMQQETTGGIDNSGCLHVSKRNNVNGDGSGGTTFLNWKSICSTKNDPTFVTKVDPNSQYLVSFKIKFVENVVSKEKLIIFYDNYSNTRKDVDYEVVKTGKWIEYKGLVSTGPAQTEIATTFNAGFTHPEMYIDDISIQRFEKRYNGPQTDVLIDFEDKDSYIIEQNDRASIDETIGPDGNKTYAYHNAGGEFNSASFINWSGITNSTDDALVIPVTPNSYYTVSMWVKMDEGDKPSYGSNTFDIFYHYEGYGDLTAISKMEKVKINDLKGQGWKKYEMEFITRADQEFIRVTVNAAKLHPDFWVDDIIVKKQMPGYITDTKLGYSEDLYNLLDAAEYKFSDTVSEKKVFELTAKTLTKYTFGATLAGNGTVTVAFDEEGKNVIKAIPVTKAEKRTAFDLLTDNGDKLYVIFEPAAGEKITYSDMTLFNTFAFAMRTAMGYEENPKDTKPNEYDTVFVDQTADDYVSFGSSESGSASPSTGDYSTLALCISLLLAPIALVALIGSKKRASVK